MQAEHSPQPGQLLGGKYRIVRILGRGAMGIVFESEHVATGKRVAVKWLHAHVMQSRSAVERLVREAQASARVRHSNVVDVYDVEREGETLFLVMEYLEGEPLTQWLERGGVPMHELLQVIVQAMRGVNEAHRRGIVHRDIKPDNIFLSYEADQPMPIAKVLDFGISKLDSPGGLSLTQTGNALGTPLYMSYEQLSGMRDVDARSDVYGFGVILYEALTGTLPFNADNFAELAAKVITSEPTPPREIRPDIPERLQDVVLWAMKKRREERTPNLSALIEALLPFTVPSEARMSMSSPRLPAIGAVASSPIASTPAPAPSLRLDAHTDWNAVIDRSQRERREMEDRVTALIAGTMYEDRRKRGEGRGFWMAGAAVGAIALGITLATLMRDSGDASPAPSTKSPATTAPEPAAAPEPAPAPSKQRTATQPAPAVQASPQDLPQPAAPTQVESVPMLRPLEAPRVDAGSKSTRALTKAPLRFDGPSGELVLPPPQAAEPELAPAPVEAPVEPPAATTPEPSAPEAAPTPEAPSTPRAPVDVNPFDDEVGDAPSTPERDVF